MRATIEEEIRINHIEDFLEKVKDLQEFKRAIKIFIEDFKGLLQEKKKIKPKGETIDEITKELKKMKTTICDELLQAKEEEEYWITNILEEAEGIYIIDIDIEYGGYIIKKISIDSFNPNHYKNSAFLWWENKEDIEETTEKSLTDEKWEKIKESIEKEDLSDELYEEINLHIQNIVEKIINKKI